jgi:hypothetical protein
VAVRGSWVVRAPREAVYAIVSDFERMPERFPRIARSMKVLGRDGDRLQLEAEAGSFGRFFPAVRIRIDAELIPGEGYRCQTHNLTFDTRGDEELLLHDDPQGTRIEYTYYVTVRRRWLRAPYAWLVRVLGLPFWKRSYLDPLEALLGK